VTKIIKLQVISPSNAEKRIIFSTDDKDALVKGVELESHVCGYCGFVLAENVMTYNYSNIVLQCPNCKSYNEAPKNEKFIA
jgi:phage FluMu protein Com